MTFHFTRGLLAAFVGGFFVAATGADAASLSYTEDFTFPAGATSQDAALRGAPINWCGGNAGDSVCDNPVAGSGSANEGGEGAISASSDLFDADGNPGDFMFWSQRRINADSWLFTESAPFHTGGQIELNWFQRDSIRRGDADPTRLFFRIGTDYYVSNETFKNPNNDKSAAGWLQFTVDPTSLTYAMFDNSAMPLLLPDLDFAAGSAVLPEAAMVDAFGFYWDGPKSTIARFDNVELTASPIPLPAGGVLLVAGLGALVVTQRRTAQA